MTDVEIKQCLKDVAENSTFPGINTSALAIQNGKVKAVGYNLFKETDFVYRPTPCHNINAVHAESLLVIRMQGLNIAPQDCEIHLSHFPCIICQAEMKGFGIKKVTVHGSMVYTSALEYSEHNGIEIIHNTIATEWCGK